MYIPSSESINSSSNTSDICLNFNFVCSCDFMINCIRKFYVRKRVGGG